MQQSTNYNMNKPDLTDQYDLSHWNDNTDIIDTELKKREDDDTALKNPIYTEAGSDTALVSGESFQTAFGKIAKAVSSFITHKSTTTSVHGSTSDATANKIVERDANSRAKIADGADIDDIASLKQIQNSALNKKFIGVRIAINSNVTLFGEQVIDGLSCVIGDIVLVMNQTTATENGIYIVQSGAWTRHSDYDTVNEINNTLICCYLGTYRGKVFKASIKTWTEGTTVLSFLAGDYPIPDEAKNFWRYKINACEEYRPGIGIPTIWMGGKPDWAIDFGNGATTKYLWTNYPNLDNNQFKNILTTLSDKGWMTAYDTSGFYVPDLRGIVPVGYGTNGLASRIDSGSYPSGGGTVGTYLESANKSHYHDFTHYHNRGGMDINGYVDLYTNAGGSSYDSKGLLQGTGAFATEGIGGYDGYTTNRNAYGAQAVNFWASRTWSGITSVGRNVYNNADVTNTSSNGTISKPPTIGTMWIVRFK